MKFKLFNLLTICLATSGLLAPAQAAFGRSEETQHLVCVKEAQRLLCEDETSKDGEKATESVKSSNATALPLLNPAQQGAIANILIWFSYLAIFGLGSGIFLYDKYCAYRAATLNKQIEFLERLWQSGSDNDATTDRERGARG